MAESKFIQFLKLALLCIVLTQIVPGIGLASDTPIDSDPLLDSLLIYKADEIEILDSKPSEETKSLFPVQELNHEEIQVLSVLNVADAVKLLPGVMIKDYGGIGGLKTISVRSLSASHTSVFIDGIKYTNSQTGQIDLGRFSTDRLSQIQVHSSGISEELNLPAQTYLTTSSLFLETEGSSFNGLNQTISWDSKLSAGSFGYTKGQLGAKWRVSDDAFLSFSVDQTDANGEYDFEFQNGSLIETLQRKNTDIHATRIESNLKLNVSEVSTLNVKGYGYFSERGLPGAIIANNYIVSQERLWNDDAFLQSTWKSKAFETIQYVVRAKYAYNYTRYYNPKHYSGTIDNRYTEHQAYTSVSGSYVLNQNLSFSASTDINWNTLKSERFNDPERLSWFSVIVLKGLYHNAEFSANLLLSAVEEQSYDDTYDKATNLNRNDLLPAVSLGYWITNQLHTSLSFKKSLRLPTFNEMYYPSFGNTDLNPEYTTQYNFGLGYQLGLTGFIESLTLKTDLYRLNIRDKIIAVPRGSVFNWSVTNINKVETTGIEFNGQVKAKIYGPVKLALSGGYTYQEALEKTPSSSPFYQPSTYGKQIKYTPKATSSMMATVYYENISLGWQMTHVGRRYTSAEQTIQNLLPPYTTHDFNMIYQFKMFSNDSTIKVELNNAFNENYDVIKSFPMPGRGFRVSLSVHS